MLKYVLFGQCFCFFFFFSCYCNSLTYFDKWTGTKYPVIVLPSAYKITTICKFLIVEQLRCLRMPFQILPPGGAKVRPFPIPRQVAGSTKHNNTAEPVLWLGLKTGSDQDIQQIYKTIIELQFLLDLMLFISGCQHEFILLRR